MNLGTFVVSALLAAVVFLDIRYLRRHGIDGCSGDCNQCHGSCKWSEDLKKAHEAMKVMREKGFIRLRTAEDFGGCERAIIGIRG